MADEAFVIDNDRKAMWAARKIAETKAELKALVDCYRDKIEKAKESCNNDIAYYEGMLERYFHTLDSASVKKTKTSVSYTLPGLKMTYKPSVAKYTYDDGALLDFVKKDESLKEYIKVSESVDWAGLKKITQDFQTTEIDPVTKEERVVYSRILKDTSEIIPVTVTMVEDFTVKLTDEGDENND